MGTTNIIIAGLFLLVIIFIMAQLIMKPVKLLWKLIINSAIGLILLLMANYGAAYFGFALPINIITVLVAGFLGIPGILLLVCFQLLLK
ncbi:MAG: SigmaK-factor processing regulatory BofA [Firmicutes bacterium HGW-Firmicutes-15]|nr:MAG: SigmaK-factor processing regulatory BofA [Firmicutes bacterium HGW-Firmicutes-15]